MAKWSHLIRFLAREDGQVHLGQLVDPSRDPGLDSVSGTEIKAYLINGDVYNGVVTGHILTVERVGPLSSTVTRFGASGLIMEAPFTTCERTMHVHQVPRFEL